jgi:hypothetical protein
VAGFQGQQGEVLGRDDQRGLLVARGLAEGVADQLLLVTVMPMTRA